MGCLRNWVGKLTGVGHRSGASKELVKHVLFSVPRMIHKNKF